MDAYQAQEVKFAALENRLRQVITELCQPTVQRTSSLITQMEGVTEIVLRHTKSLQAVELGQIKVIEQGSTIHSFKEEMSRWDSQRRSHEVSIDEKVDAMKQQVEGYRYNLEQKESALHQLHRGVDRLRLEVNRLSEQQEMQYDSFGDRLDGLSKRLSSLSTDLEIKCTGLQMRHDALSDELWGEETGLAKVGGGLVKATAHLEKLEAVVAELHGSKAEAAQLDRLRAEVAATVHEANVNVAALKATVGSVVTDVREHFRTAARTVAEHNAAFVSEVRQDYQEELRTAARVREEVKEFTGQVEKEMSILGARCGDADSKATALAKEVKEEVVELGRLRKRDKTSADNELKALKKRLGGVFQNSDTVLRGIEHIYSILELVLESDNRQCSVELQDSSDRKKISLMGVKDDETLLARTSHTEPQRPRPECRVRTAPGGTKVRSGSQTARHHPQEPVVRVDNRCLSCSGQAPMVLSAFKMACLQYTSSPVPFNGTTRDREELLLERSGLLDKARGLLVEGPTDPTRGNGSGSGNPQGLVRQADSDDGAAGETNEVGDALSKYALFDTRRHDHRGTTRLPNLRATAAA